MLCFILAFASSKLLVRDEERRFVSFMREFNQIYTGDEYQLRFGIFITNLRYIQEHNKRESSFKLGLTPFSCYTPAEYRSILGFKPNPTSYVQSSKVNAPVPESFDWREKKVVNPIKNQGQCGSCYIFSATQAAESAYAITYGELISFSEQNILDCIIGYPEYGCYGCNGGMPSSVMEYVKDIQKNRFMLESEYPYTATEGKCNFNEKKTVGWFSKLINVKSGDEDSLKEIIATHGPCSIGIDAGNPSFSMYKGGIYDEPRCNKYGLNHGIGAVGYGSENGIDYFIIRNSWGESWGEAGFGRVIRNKGDLCGLAQTAWASDASGKP